MKPRLAQVWLLGVCVLLCLSCGAEAIKCNYCNITNPDISRKCWPPYICTIPDGYCLTILIYEARPGGALTYVDKRCISKNTKVCGIEQISGDKKLRRAFVCCDENDKCLMPGRKPA
ncbi:Hypothetical predicted protein [Podarcis lilfordi]|uniref:UPAR/Ly6 domain-containing protein n=1 Tax=Podarcis lilfordi TaxID=74358 RepID=A0AA35JZ30_9SAUR|nr:Hypothetical predicted protein [Podarcis lilfordi]